MSIDLALLSAPTGGRLPIATNDATGVTFSDSVHGDEQLTATLPRTLVEGMAIYEAPMPQVVVSEHGAPIASYRLEQPAISDQALTLAGYGSSRAFNDSDLTALWSTTGSDGWREVLSSEIATALGDRFELKFDERIYIAPSKGETHGGNIRAYVAYIAPSGGSRTIVGADFDIEFIAPVGWEFGFLAFNANWTINAAVFGAVAATGALQRMSVHAAFTGVPIVLFYMRLNTAPAVYTGETGAAYLSVTNMRLVTTTANQVSTTLSGAIVAGSNVTATVGSTARMYVGQLLVINTGSTTASERVVVESIPSGTQFVADFAQNHAIGQAVQAHVVYPDEVVSSLLAAFVSFNPGQLSSSAALIQQCQQDQTDLVYEDTPGDAVLDDMERRAGWRWAVRNRILSFAPIGTNAQTWYVDAASLEVQRTLDTLINVAYATYQDGAGTTQRTAPARDNSSYNRFGLARARAIDANTSNATLAAAQRDSALEAGATPTPQAALTFDAIYTAQGIRVPPHQVHADDTIIIRNLPPQAALSRDKIRALLLTRREINVTTGEITVEAQPLETIERLIGRTTA